MRTGVLWRGGEVTMHVNIEQTMMIFLNGRANNPTGLKGPDKIVSYDQKKNRWVPFQPNPHQMELVCQAADHWYKNRHKKGLTPTEAHATV